MHWYSFWRKLVPWEPGLITVWNHIDSPVDKLFLHLPDLCRSLISSKQYISFKGKCNHYKRLRMYLLIYLSPLIFSSWNNCAFKNFASQRSRVGCNKFCNNSCPLTSDKTLSNNSTKSRLWKSWNYRISKLIIPV